jgi:ATP-binding cassette subfamily B protein IrtB
VNDTTEANDATPPPSEDGLSPQDAALTEDASLRRLTSPILISSVLSTVVAFTDAAALAGLAVRLTNGFTDTASAFGGVEMVSSLPVIAALVVVTLLLNLATTVLREKAATGWDADRRIDLVRAFRRADFPTQAAYSGAGLSAATDQIGKASNSIGAIVGLINSVVRTVIYIGIATLASWQVSAICILAGGTLMLGLRNLTRRTRRMHRDMSGRYIFVGEEIGEMAGSAREIHSLNRWDETEHFLSDEITTIQRLKYLSASLAGMVGPVYWAGTLAVGLAVAAWAGDSGTSTSGLAASGLLLIRSLNSAQGAQVMYQTYNDAHPYVGRVRTVIGELRRAERPGGAEELPPGQVLEVRDADLTYGRDVVVRGLDLQLQGPGGVALVGASGGGKSTTLLALSGMGKPASGTVAVNGVPLDLLSSRELGHVIGLLPQNPQLLRGSMRSNLVRPDVDRSDDELWDALVAVDLDSTVRGFHGHMDAAVGRAADGFSGGELQRLGLARLLINQPEIWLVDEPTSALDRENSGRVLELLTAAMSDHLVVVVTHRPELLHACKRVIFMENGRVVDDGTLAEVVARQPFVASMVAESDQPAAGDAVGTD